MTVSFQGVGDTPRLIRLLVLASCQRYGRGFSAAKRPRHPILQPLSAQH